MKRIFGKSVNFLSLDSRLGFPEQQLSSETKSGLVHIQRRQLLIIDCTLEHMAPIISLDSPVEIMSLGLDEGLVELNIQRSMQ